MPKCCFGIGPAPGFNTVRYGGVLGSAAQMRPLLIPKLAAPSEPADSEGSSPMRATAIALGVVAGIHGRSCSSAASTSMFATRPLRPWRTDSLATKP
jgi:hypothetical protein